MESCIGDNRRVVFILLRFPKYLRAPLCLCAENGCMYSFCGGDIFVMQMMFYVDMLDIKVVEIFVIFLVQKFHDFRPDGLGVIYFRSLLLGFIGLLNIFE